MTSDRGQEIFAKAMDGNATLPFGYDIGKTDWFENTSGFAKTRYDIARSATYFYKHFELPLGRLLPMFYTGSFSSPEQLFYSKEYTAQDVFHRDVDYHSVNRDYRIKAAHLSCLDEYFAIKIGMSFSDGKRHAEKRYQTPCSEKSMTQNTESNRSV